MARDGGSVPDETEDYIRELGAIAAGIDAPPAEDPEAQVEYALNLLQGFAQLGPEATAVGDRITGALDEYSATRDDDEQAALDRFQQTMQAIQIEVSDLVLKSLRRMRDDIKKRSRVLGTKSEHGKFGRIFAESLDIMAGAMELMTQASLEGDEEMKRKAAEVMQRGQEMLTELL